MLKAALNPGDEEDDDPYKKHDVAIVVFDDDDDDNKPSIKIDRKALSDAVKSTCGSYCGLTYGELLSRVLAFIETHKHARDLHRRLQEEINEGHSMCFTGQCTRLLNALQGFVDGIHIGVSVREGMKARIDRVLKRLEEAISREETVALRNELVEVLDDGGCDTGERNAWCSAFDSLVDDRFESDGPDVPKDTDVKPEEFHETPHLLDT